MRAREEYEKEINAYLISVTDKVRIFGDIRLRNDFLTLLIDYYRFYVYPNKSLDLYGLPLMETAIKCIKYFDKSKGEFLHLFNGEMKKALRRAEAKERSDRKRQGLKLPHDEEIKAQKILAFARSRNLDPRDIDDRKFIIAALGLDAEEYDELIFLNYDAVVVPSTVQGSDGNETDLIDLRSSRESTAEDEMQEEAAASEVIEKIDGVFATVQERQKRMLSMSFTAELISVFDYDIVKVKRLLCGRKIANAEVLNYYSERTELLAAKQIASECGVSPQSLSRAYKNFKMKLKEKL